MPNSYVVLECVAKKTRKSSSLVIPTQITTSAFLERVSIRSPQKDQVCTHLPSTDGVGIMTARIRTPQLIQEFILRLKSSDGLMQEKEIDVLYLRGFMQKSSRRQEFISEHRGRPTSYVRVYFFSASILYQYLLRILN